MKFYLNTFKKRYFTLFFLIISVHSFAQTVGKIQGTVTDIITTETVFGAVISVQGLNVKSLTDVDGQFSIEVPTGTYNILFQAPDYELLTKFNIQVTAGNAQILNIELSQKETEIKEVIVTVDNTKKASGVDMITPLSVQRLTSEEIKSNPGGGYDVSKVVQTLPGVGGSASAGGRNDIVIRGGAPNENVYYLDGIEVPVLNHFQTQGSSGGAQGIINVAFIDELKLSSSAFDARYDNALASTFVLKQRQGNREKLSGNVRSSLTETAFSLEGPFSKKTDFLAGGRISYLDFLFQLIDLPIRPRYQDYQFNTTTKLNDKTTIKFIGLGAIDNFSFGETRVSSPENEFLRRSLPFIKQWTYTTGVSVKRTIDKGYINFALSRNMFDNQLDRFKDAQYGNENFRNFGLQSQEIENKLRIDVNKFVKSWKYSFGISAQYVKYNADLYNQLISEQKDSLGNILVPELAIRFNTAIDFFKFGAFGQVSKRFFMNQLLVSGGIRTDINSFTTSGYNPLQTLSPRLSAAYALSKKWEISASLGRYFKLVPYTVLGYRNATNELVNKTVSYISSNHMVLGTQFLPKESLRFTAEVFYKQYQNYPSSVINGISLANQGSEFGALGNEQVISNGDGQTYGIELFAQQKLTKKIFYFLSYTYVRSFFSGTNNVLIASAWDNQHLLSATLGYKFGKNWQLGAKYRLSGGNPYTPFDTIASKQSFPVIFSGVLDYSRVNESRLKTFSQLDIRIDKTWNFKKTSLVAFLDIQNILLTKQQSTPNYTFKRNADNTDFETTDGLALKADGSNGKPLILQNESSTVVPTIGIIFQF